MDDPDQAPRIAYDPELWPDHHRVLEAFNDMADGVRDSKFKGTGLGPSVLTKAEAAFLELTLERIRRAGRTKEGDEGRDEAWSGFGEVGTAEIDAIDIRRWADPVRAVLYAAAQAAAHDGMRGWGPVEPNLNQMILDALRSKLSGIVTAYSKAGSTLPPGRFLHAGVASMQEARDLMGADLAIVVGTNVDGLPRYRVVLLQAKHEEEDARNRADVGQGEGRQLAELVSSRMGYYLFYPRPVAHPKSGTTTRLLPVVRRAENVSLDVGKVGTRGRYRVNCYRDRSRKVDAIDFAQFVSIVMTGGTPGVGRLFSTAKEVADTLSTAGRPLAPDVVAIDRTGLLSCHEFLKRLEVNGYKVQNEFRFPLAEEMKPEPHDPEGRPSPRSPLWKDG